MAGKRWIKNVVDIYISPADHLGFVHLKDSSPPSFNAKIVMAVIVSIIWWSKAIKGSGWVFWISSKFVLHKDKQSMLSIIIYDLILVPLNHGLHGTGHLQSNGNERNRMSWNVCVQNVISMFRSIKTWVAFLSGQECSLGKRCLTHIGVY